MFYYLVDDIEQKNVIVICYMVGKSKVFIIKQAKGKEK